MKTYSPAIQYGIDKEHDAKEAYLKIMKKACKPYYGTTWVGLNLLVFRICSLLGHGTKKENSHDRNVIQVL